MRVHKIILAFAVAVAACACSEQVVRQSAVDSLKEELAATKKDQAVLQAQYIQQNEDISEILSELTEISGKTKNLRLNVENGSARLTQAQQIEERISAIKKRLDDLQRSNAVLSKQGKEFKKVIDGLQLVIKEKQDEIDSLVKEIQTKDRTIKEQQGTISSQLETITAQKSELELKVKEQAALLFEAGAYLEQLGDAAPEVSWKNNKKKVAAMKQDIYKQALLYYRKALEAGYPSEESIASVQAKITE